MSEPDPADLGAVDGVNGAVDGRASRWTGQAERRREEFVSAALEAIAEYGPETSTEQIAARAGVARTRLYRHFDGAADLDRAIATRVEALVVAGLAHVWDPASSPEQIIRGAVAAHLTWLTENRGVYRYLVRHSVTVASGETAVADVKRVIADLLVRLLDDYVGVLGLDGRVAGPLAVGMVGFVDAAAERWVAEPGTMSAEEMVDVLARWIWAALDGFLRDAGVVLDPTVALVELAGPGA